MICDMLASDTTTTTTTKTLNSKVFFSWHGILLYACTPIRMNFDRKRKFHKMKVTQCHSVCFSRPKFLCDHHHVSCIIIELHLIRFNVFPLSNFHRVHSNISLWSILSAWSIRKYSLACYRKTKRAFLIFGLACFRC